MGMLDMMGMMGKVKEMQSKMAEVQESLGEIKAEGEAGAGMVKAIVTGKKQLEKIVIDHTLMTPDDREMLEDLIVAAVNIAMKEVEQKSAEALKQATEGMLPNIPGMDLSSLMGK